MSRARSGRTGPPRAVSRAALIGAGLLLAGCLPWAGMRSDLRGAVGTPARGLLGQARQLPRRGAAYRFYRGGDRGFGTPALTGLIERAAARVERAHAGTTLLVGDLSGQRGGFISGHHSHRSGRDVDLAFFVDDADGRAFSGTPLTRFDRFGVGLREGAACHFDAARNWALVEALLADQESDVQWIFVSHGLKALLLEWGLTHGADLELVQRAASVLHQPSDSAPHDDHFHVRVYCGADPEGDLLCRDLGPRWPWVVRPAAEVARRSDAELLTLALDDLD